MEYFWGPHPGFSDIHITLSLFHFSVFSLLWYPFLWWMGGTNLLVLYHRSSLCCVGCFCFLFFNILKCKYSRLVSSPLPSCSPTATYVSRKKSPYQAEQSLLILKNNQCKCFLGVPEHDREGLLLHVLAPHSVQHFHPGFAGCFPTPPRSLQDEGFLRTLLWKRHCHKKQQGLLSSSAPSSPNPQEGFSLKKYVCRWNIWNCILVCGDAAALLLPIVGWMAWYQF